MQALRSERVRARSRASSVLGVALGLAGLSVVAPVSMGITGSAAAATINLGAIQANVSDHHGTDGGNDTSNCIKYSPSGTSTSSAFVGSSGEALTAHGSDGTCPNALSTAEQSAVGVRPATTSTVQDGVPFLLARVTHYNNPVQAQAAHFSGTFTIRLGGFDTTPDLKYQWTLWETPNNANPCAFTGAGVPNQNGCADQIIFTGQVPDQTLTAGGITYKLVMKGFSPTTGTCPATQPSNTQTQFLTAEQASSVACLYASLVQVRSLTIVKRIVAPAGITPPSTTFTFDGASTIDGSAWDDNVIALTPTLANSQRSGPRELLQADTVSVTERAPTSDKWTVTSITCVDGAGGNVNATVNLAARKVTLPDIPAPPTAAAGPITCTYTNTYTPKATLTLVKSVDGGTALPVRWTLSANGPTPITGPSGSAERHRPTGRCRRLHAPRGRVARSVTPLRAGPVPRGTLVGDQLTLARQRQRHLHDHQPVLPQHLPDRQAGPGPTGGFTGTANTPFTGSWTCGATNGSFSVTQNTPYISPGHPRGDGLHRDRDTAHRQPGQQLVDLEPTCLPGRELGRHRGWHPADGDRPQHLRAERPGPSPSASWSSRDPGRRWPATPAGPAPSRSPTTAASAG